MHLLQDRAEQPKPGLLFYVPVYRKDAPVVSVQQRRAALQGYVYIAYFAADLLSGMLGPDLGEVDLEVYDGRASARAPALFGGADNTPERARRGSNLTSTQTLSIGGRVWELHYHAAPSVLGDSLDVGTQQVLILGIAVSFLLFGIVLAITRTKNQAQALAHRMTADLRAHQAELEAVSDNAPIGIFRTSPDGAAVYINAQCMAICDVSAEEVQHFGWAARLHPDDRERVLRNWTATLREGRRYDDEQRFVHRDGRVVWTRVKAAPIRQADQLLGFTGSVEDITVARDNTVAVEDSRRFVDAILDAIPQPVWVKDAQHRWVRINQSFAALRGKSREDLVGKSNYDLFPAHQAAMHWAEDDQALAQPQPLTVEEPVVTPDAQVRWMMKTIRGVTLADGSAYIVGVAADITERKEIEETLRASQSRLRLVNLISAQITAGTAIEDILRSAVLGLAGMLPGLRAGYGRLDSHNVINVLYSAGAPAGSNLAGVQLDLRTVPAFVQELRDQRGVVVPDVNTDARLRPLRGLWEQHRTGALIAVPVQGGADDTGVLQIESELPRAWLRYEIETLQEVAEALSVALRNTQAETNRRQAERSLRDSQERLQIALWASDVGLWSWDLLHEQAFFTPEWKRQLGCEDWEIRNDVAAFYDRLHADDRAAVQAHVEAISAAPDLPFELEFRMRHRDGSYRWILSRAKAERDDSGRVLRLTGAHIDITERKQAELQAERSRKILDGLMNALPQPVFVKDTEHRWVIVNDAFAALMRKPKDELLHKSDGDLFPPEYAVRAAAHDDEAMRANAPVVLEEYVEFPDGRQGWFNKSKVGVELDEGERYVVGVTVDVTAHRKAEQEAERSRTFLEAVLETIPQGVFVKDEQGRWLMVNEATCRQLGLRKDQLIGKRPAEALPPALAALVAEQDRLVFEGRGPMSFEQPSWMLDEREISLLKVASAVRLTDGSRYLVGVNTDVTDFKQAVREAENNRQFLNNLINALPAPIFVKDEQHRWVHLNDSFCRMFGASREHMIGRSDSDMLDEATALERYREDDKVFESGLPYAMEQLQSFPDGSARWGVKTKTPVVLPDGKRGIVGMFVDIHERKAAELEAVRSRQFLDAVLDAVPTTVFVKDERHRWLVMNDTALKFLGATREQVLGNTDFDLFPAEQARQFWAQDDAAMHSDRPLEYEEAFVTARGETRWVLKSKRRALLADGSRYLIGAIVDITERREGAIAIENTQKFLDALVNAVPHPIFVKDRSHRFVLVNDACCAINGVTREQMLGKTDYDFVPAALADVFREKDDLVFSTRQPDVNEEQHPDPSGRELTVVTRKALFRDSAGNDVLVGVVTDVTETKRAALEAERSRQYLEALLNALPNPIYVKDRQHRWVVINDAFCRFHGLPREALLGKTDADVLPPERAAAMFAEDDRVFAEGGAILAEQYLDPPGGYAHWALKSKRAISLPDGQDYVVSLLTDITQRKRIEQALLESEERLRLLNAIAHGMTQGRSMDAIVRQAIEGMAGIFGGLRWTYAVINRRKARIVHCASSCNLLDITGLEYEIALDDNTVPAHKPWNLVRLDAVEQSASRIADADGALLGVRALLAVPLAHEDELIGLLCAASDAPLHWSDRTVEVAREVSEYLAVGWRNTRIEQRRSVAEKALRASEARLSAIIENAVDAIVIADGEGRIETVNPAVAQLFGYSAAELAGRNVRVLLPGAAEQQSRSGAGVSATQRVFGRSGETNGLRRDGSDVQVDLGVSEVQIGERRMFIGMLRDISERKLAEEALRESEERFRSLTMMSSDWYWEQDQAYRFVAFTAGTMATPGFEADKMIGHTRWELHQAPADDADWKRHKGQLEARLPFRDLVFRSGLHNSRVISASGEPIFDGDGVFRGYRGVSKDITERVMSQEELRRHRDNLQELVQERTRELMHAKDAAEQASRAKSQFLANMSHELRTPMHAILSYARLGIDKLAADGLPKQKMQQYFTRIDQGGERLLHLLNDLLDLSKLEAGKMIYHMVSADLQELARACITQFEVLARGRSVTLTLSAHQRGFRCLVRPRPHRSGARQSDVERNQIFAERGYRERTYCRCRVRCRWRAAGAGNRGQHQRRRCRHPARRAGYDFRQVRTEQQDQDRLRRHRLGFVDLQGDRAGPWRAHLGRTRRSGRLGAALHAGA